MALPAAVRVRAPARLHLGFLDLGGALGRRFGSLGLTLERPLTDVTVARAPVDSAEGPDAARAARVRDRMRTALGLEGAFAVRVESALLAHGGLGSGTQLALAVGVALTRLCGQSLDARAVATVIGRGLRSAIGVEAFTQGGIILDGGKPTDAASPAAALPPPLLSRLPIPANWRVVLVFDTSREGLSGDAETRAMAELPPFPEALAAHLSHLMLLRALPALAEGDIATFGAAIGEWQRALGDHYAAAQGGGRFSSPMVADAVAFMEGQGFAGVGQSSWGPTGFALVGDPSQAQQLVEVLRHRFASFTNLTFDCVPGNNHGAEIRVMDAEASRGGV
ncbi:MULTISPECIES: beta-ribofuranosylaminobenzene 5'-phosphate synthase family protein [unclassified Xanthobacter]|uniref:beta-ribofuranosylaminobenzene 5'-phosphate synthase family protein n=1 Tax=unclassified Xanthobacter TaxID=2623496 RepID=UPI001EDE39DE|nr:MULTISPECIES: beta-ribofuranosylaminobenzene 5'-phosphate synthase family protein [unclassified Xanthobacter]